MVDHTESAIIDNLKKAGYLIREACQMTLPHQATPEDAASMIVSLLVRAIVPRNAIMEFSRLGGTNPDKFKVILRDAIRGKSDIEWWEGWKTADPRDKAMARTLARNCPDDLAVKEDEGRGAYTPEGVVRFVELAGFAQPRPLWTFYLNLARLAREEAKCDPR